MKKLIKGLHKFQTEVFPIQKDFFHELARGQNPEILFICCSDSRINPNLVTSAEPGDLFIMRNAGNIIPPYGSGGSEEATIEFALTTLKVNHIIICGHSHCGALQAVLKDDDLSSTPCLWLWLSRYVSPTLTLVRRNYEHSDYHSLTNILLQEHVLAQIENLKTHPTVVQALENHTLTLHAWLYKFEDGDIFSFDQQSGQFDRIKQL